MLIEHILHNKGSDVARITTTGTIAEAVAMLRERNIGALVVTDDGAVAGMLSERDVVRALADPGTAPGDLMARSVAELMTPAVTTCGPRATADELMRMMTDQRVRHIPVMDGAELVGIVSIGDVVKSRIDELQTEADTLHDYLASGR